MCKGQGSRIPHTRDTREGGARAHEGARTIVRKISWIGCYWPTIYQDTEWVIYNCDKCQKYAPIPRNSATPMISFSSPCSFIQWRVDIVGPFPEASGKVKFLVMEIDYFTKSVEAEPLGTITFHNKIKFFWKLTIFWFGVPHTLISDIGAQFANNPFREWCKEFQINQRFTLVAHPEGNGQTKVTNQTIVHGLTTRLNEAKGRWVDEIRSVLWVYQTTTRMTTK